jgi:ParB-like chromosome segregation protein Spo0J
MADSLFNSILAQPNPDGSVTLVNGHRRWVAAQQATSRVRDDCEDDEHLRKRRRKFRRRRIDDDWRPEW